MVAVTHLVYRAGGGGHESGLPAGREEHALEASQGGLLEEWAANRECEELEGVWLEPIQAML